jgi:VanZ family protein
MQIVRARILRYALASNRVEHRMTSSLFRAGLLVHAVLVVLIVAGAYAGVVPTHLASVPHADWIGHVVLIGLLAFFLDGALALKPLLGSVRLAPVLVLACAGIEEYAQRFSPRRTSSWGDFAADAVGVVLFSWMAGRVYRAREPAISI